MHFIFSKNFIIIVYLAPDKGVNRNKGGGANIFFFKIAFKTFDFSWQTSDNERAGQNAPVNIDVGN